MCLNQSRKLSSYLGQSIIKTTDTENQYKVSQHTFGLFTGKSPKQGEPIYVSLKKYAITYKDKNRKSSDNCTSTR